MILLDSDHLSVLADPRQTRRTKLAHRLRSSGELVALPVVSLEEQFRGWLALIRRLNDVHKQIIPYLRFQNLIFLLRDWEKVVWNEPTADLFKRPRADRIRIESIAGDRLRQRDQSQCQAAGIFGSRGSGREYLRPPSPRQLRQAIAEPAA